MDLHDGERDGAHDGDEPGISLKEHPDRSVVRLTGEIDLDVRRAAGGICRRVAERALPVVVDAREVTFMDSTGMSILVRMARDAEEGGYRVTVHEAPWILQELLSITGVDRLVPLVDPQDDPARTRGAGPGRDA